MIRKHKQKAAAPERVPAPALGQLTKDGIYVGLTRDGTQHIYALPKDLDAALTFNDAAEAIRKLNANNKPLDHDDWQIPSLDALRVLHQNQDVASLKDIFAKEAGSNPDNSSVWYWSSNTGSVTPWGRVLPDAVRLVSFSDKGEHWALNEGTSQASCRPVRLVKAL